MKKVIILILLLFVIAGVGYAAYKWPRKIASTEEIKDVKSVAKAVKHLHRDMPATRSGDWLASHDESGQTFKQYLRANPVTLTKKRNKLYVQPIGKFAGKSSEIIKLSAEFMKIYFGCEVVVNKNITSDDFPERAKRVHPSWGVRQLLSTYILDDVLKPKLPDDAFAMIAFTEKDLWPGRGWNFVFGQASLRGRVGVWSIYRNGDPRTDFALCLDRTLKTATHETGHMFSIQHCIAYRCNMNGSNSRDESDRHPLFLCPECLPKILVATQSKSEERFKKLAAFCKKHKLKEAAEYYERAYQCIRKLNKKSGDDKDKNHNPKRK